MTDRRRNGNGMRCAAANTYAAARIEKRRINLDWFRRRITHTTDNNGPDMERMCQERKHRAFISLSSDRCCLKFAAGGMYRSDRRLRINLNNMLSAA